MTDHWGFVIAAVDYRLGLREDVYLVLGDFAPTPVTPPSKSRSTAS
jgi:hypothetical protein